MGLKIGDASRIDREYWRFAQAKGQLWDTQQFQADFEVLQFLAPHVFVRRRADGVIGTMRFADGIPYRVGTRARFKRFYYGFVTSEEHTRLVRSWGYDTVK